MGFRCRSQRTCTPTFRLRLGATRSVILCATVGGAPDFYSWRPKRRSELGGELRPLRNAAEISLPPPGYQTR